jgi:4-alpha-glucanotransferase
MESEARIGGVLLHPTSLPSGKLDNDAFRWLDFMSEAGLQLWQVLPLGVPQGNLSPYQCYSAFALNPALMILATEMTHEQHWDSAFQNWCQQEKFWLHDYALFMVLKHEHDHKAWFQWPDIYKYKDPVALKAFQQQHEIEILSVYWQQYQLYTRWQEIRDYAADRNIYLFGDMPIFVAHDSADVWANRQYFLLDDHGMPSVVAGVPPDYFSATGQRWGNPHYNWETMQENQFDWWLARLKNHLALFDLVRIDHFRGLEAVWVIDASEETAEQGVWQKVPGKQLLQYLQDEMGNVPLVAEDLGIITPEVNALREQFHLPGMSVLQFSFDGFEDNPHKPQNIGHDRIVYTGTHDNDTTEGWFQSLDAETRAFVLQRLNIEDPVLITDSMIKTAFGTEAQLAIIPLQDFLGLGSDARMNIPGTLDGNWQWQFSWDQISPELAEKIRQQIKKTGRVSSTLSFSPRGAEGLKTKAIKQ